MTNQIVDERAKYELMLWFENTEDLYNNQREAWILNFNRKIKRGIFKEELAIKGLVYLVEHTAADYRKHFGNQLADDYGIYRVNMATKLSLARDIFEQDIKRELSGFNY